jgi:hypothetical protein
VSSEEGRVRAFLLRAITEFEKDRLAASTIRRFAMDAPVFFIQVGMELLLKAPETAGYRYLAMQLVKQPTLFEQITDTWRYSKQQSVTLARRLLSVDPTLDTRLARALPGRNGGQGLQTLEGPKAERAIEILDEISEGRRVVPILNHLTDHPDLKISSKAALLIGKRVQNVDWAKRVIMDTRDPRLRANAIESVWGNDTPAVLELFRSCLQDRQNRVVGNSLMGLHLAGDPEVHEIVAKFARDFKAEFRMTAAWTMGKIGDPGFVESLTALIKDSNPGVRRAALKALRDIRQVEKRHQEQEAQKQLREDAHAAAEAEKSAEAVEMVPPVEVELRLDGSKYSSDTRGSKRFKRYAEW